MLTYLIEIYYLMYFDNNYRIYRELFNKPLLFMLFTIIMYLYILKEYMMLLFAQNKYYSKKLYTI